MVTYVPNLRAQRPLWTSDRDSALPGRAGGPSRMWSSRFQDVAEATDSRHEVTRKRRSNPGIVSASGSSRSGPTRSCFCRLGMTSALVNRERLTRSDIPKAIAGPCGPRLAIAGMSSSSCCRFEEGPRGRGSPYWTGGAFSSGHKCCSMGVTGSLLFFLGRA